MMRSKVFLPVFLCLFLLLAGGPVARAQFTDEFEPPYTVQSATTEGGIFSGPLAPGWLPMDGGWSSSGSYDETTGISGSAQRITAGYGEGYLAKQFPVTPGKYIRVHIWLKTATSDGASQANGSQSWIEYGWDPTGQVTTLNAPTTFWHKDEADAPKKNLGANYDTWTEYQMPDRWVQQVTGNSISVWLKCGSVGSGGIRGDFDNLTVEELDFPPGGVTAADFPDSFDGTYVGGLAPDWYPVALPGGTDLNYEEATGRSGEAQRLRTTNANIGVVKLFSVPTLTYVRLSIWAQTSSANGSEAFNPDNGSISIGYDTSGQLLDMGAATIVWDDAIGLSGGDPYGNWTQFQTDPFFLPAGTDEISVWFRTIMNGDSAGARADFDDLELVVEGVISGTDRWELYR
jgi:hypothetical protein